VIARLERVIRQAINGRVGRVRRYSRTGTMSS
jgi:hypothetical protein